MRVLTNLLVAHLCCEANSFLACATSVKPTAYYPIITKFIIFITKISKNVWRAGLDFLIFSGLRYKLPRHFCIPSLLQLFFTGKEWVRSTQRQGAESMIDNSVMRLVSSDG